jgi:hypothetical protein
MVTRAEGRWLGDVDFNLTTVSWADLVHELRRQAPPGAYHNGIEVHGLASDNDAAFVTMKTSEGSECCQPSADGLRMLRRSDRPTQRCAAATAWGTHSPGSVPAPVLLALRAGRQHWRCRARPAHDAAVWA